jgi:hypothetical protein
MCDGDDLLEGELIELTVPLEVADQLDHCRCKHPSLEVNTDGWGDPSSDDSAANL